MRLNRILLPYASRKRNIVEVHASTATIGGVHWATGLAPVASVQLLETMAPLNQDQYSTIRERSLIAMAARRIINRANGTASIGLVKPFAVLAVRVLGPGPLRLRMVKLAHNLGTPALAPEPEPKTYLESTPVQPTSRAA